MTELLCADLTKVLIDSAFAVHRVLKAGHLEATYRNSLIVVECKTAKAIVPEHHSQLLNYLHLSRMPIGFVLNFHKKLTLKRMVYDRLNPDSPLLSND